MDPQTKRTLLATVLCIGILVGWLRVSEYLYPTRPETETTSTPAGIAAGTSQPASPATPVADAEPPRQGPDTRELSATPTSEYHATEGATTETAVLGDDHQNFADFRNPFEFAAGITSRGAGVEWLKLARHRNHVAEDKKNPDHDPYDLLRTVTDDRTGSSHVSFVTRRIRFKTLDQGPFHTVDLDQVDWTLEQRSDEAGQTATLRTRVKRGETDLLAIEKSYRIAQGSHHLETTVSMRNLTDEPYQVILVEGGPIGIRQEDHRYEYRRVVTALVDDQGVASLGSTATRDDMSKTDEAGRAFPLPDAQHTLWAALGNKYFACIVAVLPMETAERAEGPRYADYLDKVSGAIRLDDPEAENDLTFDLKLIPPQPIRPGQQMTMRMEAFCGPKSEALFEKLPEATQREYHIIRSADSRWCTFEIITTVMLWLLTRVYGLIGNYGIAIFVLVVIVRLILHPVTKRGQINMMKMQKGMGQLKPKLEVIQEQYKNDKQKLQQEQMKLYREEGINPAGQILGCLPMFLQMPVWVALWTTLNTNVDMRHEPFFWWINDLAAPDALIPLPLSWHFTLPMLGAVEAFNLLPLIMTATMYGQQKLTQKLTKPTTPAKPKLDKNGRPLPDQMAQQQKMMSFMMIFFGIIFYNFPSGLNLYILSSNLLGMLEQWRIKKHIREKDERGELEVRKTSPAADKVKPSRIGGYIERLQKKAEQARLAQSSSSPAKSAKKRGKARR